ncbi:MAG: hypothetical protein QOH39_771 [Verrucomicrobiota bacterium]|jgi:hypothetical protein
MHALTIINIAFATLLIAACSKSPTDKLVGEWKGTDSTGSTASVMLGADHTFRMVMGNSVLDGPTLGGKLEWRLDATHDPMALDVIAKKSSGEQRVIPMIVRFITDQKLQLRFSVDMQSRPASFSVDETRDQIIVTKQ